MSIAQAKGTNMLHARAYVLSVDGEAAWRRVLDALSTDHRAVVEGMVAVGWYDLEVQLTLFRVIDRVLGVGDGRRIVALARFEAEQDLTRIHRLFLRLASPAFVLEKAGEYWARFYTTGKWQVHRDSPRHATGVLSGVGVVDAVFCSYLSAYILRMFELVGAKAVMVEHPTCRARGDDVCTFRGRWSAGDEAPPSSRAG